MLVLVGAVSAMMTKAPLVATIGAELREWLQRHVPEAANNLLGCLAVLFSSCIRDDGCSRSPRSS